MLSDYKLSKFNKFIYFPDLANKFLFSNYHSISMKESIYLRYIFTNKQAFNGIPIKAILMIESIYPQRAKTKTRLIFLKFAKTRCHSFIYVKFTVKELYGFLPLFTIKPVSTRVLKSYLSSSKYFIFPGFVSHLQFPSWNRSVQLSTVLNLSNFKYAYFFHKISYLE